MSASFLVLLFHSIHRVISHAIKNKGIINPIITIMTFTILITDVLFNYSAGIYASSINYLYPLACALYGISIFIRSDRAQKYKYFIATFALIFSVFNEQIALAILVLSTIRIAYIILRRPIAMPFGKRSVIQRVVPFTLSFAGVLNVILCPGNHVRQQGEVTTFFPAFGTLNLPAKIALGIDSTFAYLTSQSFLLFYLIVIAISAILLLKNKPIQSLVCAVFAIFCFLPHIVAVADYSKVPMVFNVSQIFSNSVVSVDLSLAFMKSISLHLYYLLVFLGIIIVLIMLYKYSKRRLHVALISLGILLRLAVSFSPAVLISETRPFLITFICFYIALFLIGDELLSTVLGKNNNAKEVGVTSDSNDRPPANRTARSSQ
ncbi:MAG: hypothetical protein LBC50_00790 [Candidatus Ancillula sp.]|jgi:hypothetical protein|nr:hypothetical protein [Candidatus Ancillula sp.]